MKTLLFAMAMIVGFSLSAEGKGKKKDGKREVTGYYYSDNGGRLYEVKKTGSGYLLFVDDSTLHVRGYCMLDSAKMEKLRLLLQEASLDGKARKFQSQQSAKDAKTWRLRIRSTEGSSTDDEWVSHRGYLDDTEVADAADMHRCMEQIEAMNRWLLEHLQMNQNLYGHQVFACMEHAEYGYPYMLVDSQGKQLTPREDFWYFNYGDHAMVESLSVQSETRHKSRMIADPVGDVIAETLKVERYVKPDIDMRVLDAPSSVYTFYLFDGRCVSFNKNYMERYEGEWIVEKPWQVEKILKIED